MPLRSALILCVLVSALAFGGGFLTARLQPGPPPEVLPPLPPKVVTVTVVKEIKVPGPERVVERVRFVTQDRPVEVEKLKVVESMVDPVGRVRLDAQKFKGLQDGKVSFGWKGRAVCEFKPKTAADEDWLTLVESPFDLTASQAEIAEAEVVKPALVPKVRVDLGVGSGLRGLAFSGEVAFRLRHKSSLAKVLAPDWVGGEVVSMGHDAAILLKVGKEF